jgi:hypothetical protein
MFPFLPLSITDHAFAKHAERYTRNVYQGSIKGR